MAELEVDEVNEGAKILSYNFKTIQMKQSELLELSSWMLKYSKAKVDDSKLTKEEKKRQQKLVKDFEAPVPEDFDQSKKLGNIEIT